MIKLEDFMKLTNFYPMVFDDDTGFLLTLKSRLEQTWEVIDVGVSPAGRLRLTVRKVDRK